MKKTKSPRGISLVIHTKNESKNIVDCILSAEGIADEVLVIDMLSSDNTIELAEKMGARIFNVEDVGFADSVRNFGISKTKFKWVLCLDADERLTKKLAKRIKAITKNDQYDVVMLPFKNIRLGKWMKHTGFWPDYHPRLFKKGYLKWQAGTNQPHVPPTVIKGRILTLDAIEENAVVHYNIISIKQFLPKLTKYYLLEGGGDYFGKRKITPADLMNYCKGEFRYRYIEEKGYLDGMRGFVFSKFREYYKFLEFVKWWERKGYPEIFNQEQLLELGDMERGKEELNMFKKTKIFEIWRLYCKYRYMLKDKILR